MLGRGDGQPRTSPVTRTEAERTDHPGSQV